MVAVDICNLALSYLGDAATVASIDPPDGSAQAQHCARFYPIALNSMLESHQWSFATQRAFLAQSGTMYYNTWLYTYSVPAGATEVISVLPSVVYGQFGLLPYLQFGPAGYLTFPYAAAYPFEQNGEWSFQIETAVTQQGTQQIILSNAPVAIARFTTSNVQPGSFPAQFTDALAWKLASMLAGPLLKGDVGAAESKRCLQAYAVFMSQAETQDANQQKMTQQPIPESILVRL